MFEAIICNNYLEEAFRFLSKARVRHDSIVKYVKNFKTWMSSGWSKLKIDQHFFEKTKQTISRTLPSFDSKIVFEIIKGEDYESGKFEFR